MAWLDKLQGTALRAVILVACGLTFALLGYDQGVLGSLVGLPRFLAVLGNPNSTILGLVVAIYSVGCMIGCGLSACYGLRLGRRKTMLLGCTLVMIGGSVQAAVYHIAQMVIFRVIAGMGTGLLSSTVPVWISEIFGPTKRGQKTAIQLTCVLSGNVIAYWLEYGTGSGNSDFTFRFPIAFQCVWPLLAFILVLGLPESPRVLYFRGATEEADKVLCRLHGIAEPPESNPVTAAEKQSILDNIEFERAMEQHSALSWRHIFWDKTPIRNSRRVAIIVILQALQQLSGCNVIAYYQTTLFNQSIGLGEQTSRLLAGCSALCFWAGTLPCIYLIEKMGRRRLMLLGSLGCFATLLTFTLLLAVGGGNKAAGWGAVVMVFAFEFIYGASWTTVVWIYSAEISPLRFRHINSGLGVMSQWGTTFLTVMMAPTAIANTGWRIYIFFLIFAFLQMPFVYFFCPETAGRTLEDLDESFSAKIVTSGIEVNKEGTVEPSAIREIKV